MVPSLLLLGTVENFSAYIHSTQNNCITFPDMKISDSYIQKE